MSWSLVSQSVGSVMTYKGKRIFDTLLVVLASPIWIPIAATVALMVRMFLGKPVFFTQMRAGREGVGFRLIKFRTMTTVCDVDGRLLPDEDRLTPFGKWLRSTSLDELPELVNVLRGEMSLVGPRPLHISYVARYSAYHRRRLNVLPGITGLAQVSGRNAIGWPARFDCDVRYVMSCSFLTDLRILLRTAAVVCGRTGISAQDEVTMPEFRGYE